MLHSTQTRLPLPPLLPLDDLLNNLQASARNPIHPPYSVHCPLSFLFLTNLAQANKITLEIKYDLFLCNEFLKLAAPEKVPAQWPREPTFMDVGRELSRYIQFREKVLRHLDLTRDNFKLGEEGGHGEAFAAYSFGQKPLPPTLLRARPPPTKLYSLDLNRSHRFRVRLLAVAAKTEALFGTNIISGIFHKYFTIILVKCRWRLANQYIQNMK
ncbi:hypothetical protein PTTG_25924 [Puccinia triticina 1-1 BBBD Race 1]|uniref:Uncharacterized protein n=1 Tax=Puccinia triticina (isolate 1-1 / race 1 (BBBD)) TaxID=630390 RepID=A0A180GZ94_PUCT1|nr:hypothetical protein PTTG_25924 [Puccinia triticina 1-1 BBBD Race 1]